MKGKGYISNLTALILILSFALFIGVSIFGFPQDTYAATSVKVGNFRSGTTGDPVVITGLGFQPKAVIFFWTWQDSTGFSSGMSIGEGFAVDGVPIVNRGVAGACDDNYNPTNCGRRRSETYSIIFLSNGTPTLDVQGSVTSFSSEGFTVTWTANPSKDAYINYMAIGGDDITNVKAGTINAATSPATQSFTTVGFQPNFVMFLASLNETVDTSVAHMLFNTGFMTLSSGVSSQAAISIGGQDGVVSGNHTWRYQRTDSAIMSIGLGGSEDWRAIYSSMDPNGFILNFPNPPGASMPIFYLALAGGTHRIVAFNQPTSGITPFTLDYNVSFEPVGLFLASFDRDSTNSIVLRGEISLGAASSSSDQGTIWGENRNNATSDANMSITTDKVLQMATGPTPATEDAAAVFSSFLPTGYRLNWTKIDGIASQFFGWTIGGNITVVGNDTAEPGNVTIGPGAGATKLDAFTLNTSAGSDTVTEVKVTLSSGSSGGVSLVEITNENESVVYGSQTVPDSGTDIWTIGTSIPVTTALAKYKVRITPKSHVNMDPPQTGIEYQVTGTVTGITCIYPKVYTDSGSATITIDNDSPDNPAGFSGIPKDTEIVLNWTNPTDSDYSQAVILRRASADVTDTPVEGTTYSVGNPIGSSTVACVVDTPGTTCTDTGLINGTSYYYKIFAKDLRDNYSYLGSSPLSLPYIPAPYVEANTSGSQITLPDWMEAGDTDQYIGAAFTFQKSSGAAETITALTISNAGSASGYFKLKNVKVYYESVASCSASYSGTKIDTSFNISNQIVLNPSPAIPVAMKPNLTCVYVVFDVDLSAIKETTVDLQITNSTHWTLSGGTNKFALSYPVMLPGSTILKDTTPPGNLPSLTTTPDSNQITFNWTNPSDADYTGVRIRRKDGASAPTDCTTDGTTVVDRSSSYTSYTDSTVSNGNTYSYRLCSYDESPNPNYSAGVIVENVMPSSKPILTYPAAPYNDGKNPDTGDTTTDFTFKVIYTDWQNEAPATGYPKIYMGDIDGFFGYAMTAEDPGDITYSDGKPYYFTTGLGAAADLRFYFKVQAATGDTTDVYLPSDVLTGGYSTGPSVYLMGGYNMVGVPKELDSGLSYASVLGDDSGYPYCAIWDSTGLDTIFGHSGDYSDCKSGYIEKGKGYYIWASDYPSSYYRLDEPSGVVNVTALSTDIALNPYGGWNMISNPYNAIIELQNVEVIRNSTPYTFSAAVSNGWIDNTIYEWEGPFTGYKWKKYSDNPPATLEPWIGYFIYVKDNNYPLTLKVSKPVP